MHQSRLRNEITRAKAEQNSYLQNVELAKQLKKREEKAAAVSAQEPDKAKAGEVQKESKGKRAYKQREAVDRAQGLKATGMDSVLGSIFG